MEIYHHITAHMVKEIYPYLLHLSNTSGANTGLIAKADTVVKHQT